MTHRGNGAVYPDQHLRCQQVPVFIDLQAGKSCCAGLDQLSAKFLQGGS